MRIRLEGEPASPVRFGPLLLDAAVSLLGIAVLLCGLELALRSDAVFRRLPLVRPYYSYDVTRRLHALDRLLDARGRVDVLFLGSSVARAGFNPTAFDVALARDAHLDVTSFNAGLSSMFPPGARLYLEHVWLPRARPRFVLQGIREAELRSTPSRPRYLKHGDIEPLWWSRAPLAPLRAKLLGELQLLQRRGTLIKALERFAAGKPLHLREAGELTTDARGFRKERVPLAVNERRHSKRLWQYGYPAGDSRYAKTFRTFDAMRALCERAGATFVLVNVPEHPRRFGRSRGREVFRRYHERMREWAAAHRVPFLDVTDARLEAFAEDRWFSDYHHLSPLGARHFSELVAARFAALEKRAAR